MIVKTLNSTYEVDVEGMRFRRLSGKNDPTPNIGADEEWHAGTTTIPEPGKTMVMFYEGSTRMTITSQVQSVEMP